MGIIPEKKCFKDPTQIFKFIILFLCGMFTCSQVAQCFQKYLYPPASTYSEYILNESLRYPCLTICRRPAYKVELFRSFGISSSLDSSFAFRNFNFSRTSLVEFLDTVTYDFNEIFGQYAYALRGFSEETASKEVLKITSSFHLRRGRCFTFQPLLTSNMFSVSGGYMFFFYHNNTNPQMNEYGVSTNGFQIYLHEPNEAVTYDDDEKNNFLEILDLEASEDMRVKFDIQEFGRLPTKENLCNSNPDYSKSKCEERCVNTQLVNIYNCTAPFLALPEDLDVPECSTYSSIRWLIRDYISPITRQALLSNCNCLMACNFTVYKTSIINRRKMETRLSGHSMLCLYSTNLVFRMSEVLGYDFNQLLSDVGGSLGFLLGLSVISVICLCEELFKLIFRWFFKKKNKKENDDQTTNSVATDQNIDNKSISENNSGKYHNINQLITSLDFYEKPSELNEINNKNLTQNML